MMDISEPSAVAAPTPGPEAVAEPVAPTVEGADDAAVEADILVEDVSIDGMCGVY